MPEIISKQRFESERARFFETFLYLEEKLQNSKNSKNNISDIDISEELEKWRKLKKNFERMKKCYSAKKVLTIKTLRFFEKYQLSFKEEKRAVIVRCIELLKKLLWHKKLNRMD